MPGLQVCSRCGGSLVDRKIVPSEREVYPPRRSGRRRRRLTSEDRIALGRRPGWFIRRGSPRTGPSTVAAGLLSLLPGLGHWYLGLRRRGLQAAGLVAGALAICVVTFRLPVARLHPLLIGSVWGLVTSDAILRCEERRGRRLTNWQQRLGAGFLGGALGVLFLLLLVAGASGVRFPMYRFAVAQYWPHIRDREPTIMVDRWSYGGEEEIRPGDYLVADVAPLRQRFISLGRVMAVPGDRVGKVRAETAGWMLEVNGTVVCPLQAAMRLREHDLEEEVFMVLFQSQDRHEDPRSPTGWAPQQWMLYRIPEHAVVGRGVYIWYPPRIRGRIPRVAPGPWPWTEEYQ